LCFDVAKQAGTSPTEARKKKYKGGKEKKKKTKHKSKAAEGLAYYLC
jgi:hypothetical protein